MHKSSLGALAGALAEKLGVKVLSPEFEILLDLYDFESFSAIELQLRSSISSSAFYAKLKRMVCVGVIRLDKSQVDRRVSVYSLAPETRRILDVTFQVMDGWAEAKSESKGGGSTPFDLHLATASNQLELNLFSPEYRVIISIYDCEPIATSELLSKTRLANSRFYAALTLLTARGTIRSLVDFDDRRRRIYRLPRRVRLQLDQLLRDFRVVRSQPEREIRQRWRPPPRRDVWIHG